MRKPPAIARIPTTVPTNATAISILYVGPLDADHSSLAAIVDGPNWIVMKAHDPVTALNLLQQNDIAVVICERDLHPGSYINVLEEVNALPNGPALIVASRLADNQLWAEALNLGAWDVLATPFDRNEVIRTVESGWRHWQLRGECPNCQAKPIMAATGT